MRSGGRNAPIKPFASPDEVALIKYQIELTGHPEITKAGLQRLCSLHELGQNIPNSGQFRTLIIGLMFTGDTLVRRWSYKAIVYIGRPEDTVTLMDRMRSERDHENLTWIMSGIFALSQMTDVAAICREVGAEFGDSMALAALLYGKDAIKRLGSELPRINVENADPLTLKWCALLAGYEKAPPDLLHPKHANRDLLGVLNEHDVEEVAEYSVWALWKSPEFGINDLAIPHDNLIGKPENVRRWTNRLIAKHPEFLANNLDLFDTLYGDTAFKAREGLAIGIRDIHLPDLEARIWRWFSREEHPGLQELLLEHMATQPLENDDTFDLLVCSYKNAPAGGGLRHRLRAALPRKGSRLFQAFMKIDASVLNASAQMQLTDDIAVQGGIIVNNKTTFNVGGNLNAQNVSGGDMVAVKNEAIQHLKQSDTEVAEGLERIVAEIEAQRDFLSKEHSAAVLSAVNDTANAPNEENKTKLLQAINVAASSVTLANAATKLPELAALVSTWL